MAESPNLDAARRALAETTRSLAQQVVPKPPGPQFKIAEVTAVSGSDISVDFGDGTPVDNLSMVGGSLTVGDIVLVLVDPPIATVIGAVDGGAGGGGGGGGFWQQSGSPDTLEPITNPDIFQVFTSGGAQIILNDDPGNEQLELISSATVDITAQTDDVNIHAAADDVNILAQDNVNITANGFDIVILAVTGNLDISASTGDASFYADGDVLVQSINGDIEVLAGSGVIRLFPLEAGGVAIDTGGSNGTFVEFHQMPDPAAPAANFGRLYVKDNSDGKSEAYFKDETPYVYTLTQETYRAASVTGATTVDYAKARVHKLTMTGNITLTLSGATSGLACDLTLYLVQDGTGSRLVTWPASVKWPGAVAPLLSTPASSVDIVVMETFDGGTTWYANFVGKAYA